MNSPKVYLEVCVDSVESAMAAQQGGAARIELCADLSVGGVTPSAGMITAIREKVFLPLYVMIRPRGGDFCYSETEYEVLRHDIINVKKLGADGVVCGILTNGNDVDIQRTKEVIALASPMSFTFHRAFDLVPDFPKALEDIISIGAHRILTSGRSHTAMEGLKTLIKLVQQAKERIGIIAAGGIDENNISTIIRQTGVKEVHVASAVITSGNTHTSTIFGVTPSVVDSVKVGNLTRIIQ